MDTRIWPCELLPYAIEKSSLRILLRFTASGEMWQAIKYPLSFKVD